MRRLGNGQKKHKKRPKHLGEMRTTQLITSYGVGAIVDFRDETGILAEADHWYFKNDPDEDRIIHCHSLEKILDKDFFVMPKWDSVPHAVYQKYRSQDIGAYRFPNMLYCPRCCRLIHEKTLGGTQPGILKCPKCGDSRLVPSRFIVVCVHGHLDDFPYDAWVHEGKPCPKRKENDQPNLKLKNIDGRNSISSLMVFCDDCQTNRSMQDALVGASLKSVYKCSGRRPWLKIEYGRKPCSQDAVTSTL